MSETQSLPCPLTESEIAARSAKQVRDRAEMRDVEIEYRPDDIRFCVDAQPNAEIRRCMIEKLGADRYLRETNAQLIATDEYGKLWRKPQAGDEDLVMVEVRNSTPEPDGSIKDYWLRVPPTMRSPQQAIAWTFGIDKAADYAPVVQT